MEQYFLFFLLALIAEIIGTVSGFGSSILFVPIASLFFAFKTVLGITAVFHVFSNLSKIFLFRKGINKQIALKLGIPAVIFVILGAWLTTFIDNRRAELIMDIVLLILAIFLVVYSKKNIAQRNSNLIVGGIMSGFLAGFVGTGGAIRGITLSAFGLPKEIFVATSAFIDLGVDTSRAVVYISNGYFDKKFIAAIPVLILISFIGSYIGKKILARTSEHAFKYLVLILIIATSVFQLIKYFAG